MQQELRWLAIVTRDPTLIEIFKKGYDMHSRVCCQIHGFNYDMFEEIRNYKGESEQETQENIQKAVERWANTPDIEHALKLMAAKTGKKIDSLTPETLPDVADFFELSRKKTKSVVFGVVYGITEVGLADQIEDTREEAKKLIEGFKSGLPGYLRWESAVHSTLMRQGYVTTVLGRKRRFGEVLQEAMQSETYKKYGRHYLIERAKRQATNFIIQGSSADQVKKAMVDLFYPRRPDGTICFDREEWVKNGYKSLLEELDVNIILQIHDELVFDCPATIKWEDLQRIAKTMQQAIPNDVGVEFKSDIEVSPYWAGKFTPEQLQALAEGRLNWREVFWEEVKKKLGIEYELGTFAEADDEEEDME